MIIFNDEYIGIRFLNRVAQFMYAGLFRCSLLTVCILVSVSGLKAQNIIFEQNINPFPVQDQNGRQLLLPFLGGLRSPIIEVQDLDNDGILELILYDQGIEAIYFKVSGSAEQIQFDYQGILPGRPQVVEWFRFVDIDRDGDRDLLTNNGEFRIRLYLNQSSDAASLNFSLASSALRDAGGQQIILDGSNIPHWGDIDCDGAPEMFAATQSDQIRAWRQNSLVDGVPDYQLISGAYQGITLADPPSGTFNNANSIQNTAKHGANTITLVDIDNDLDADGDIDLIVGNGEDHAPDAEENARIYFYRNTGTANQAEFELIDTHLLGADFPFQRNYAPAFGDIDSDGDADLLLGDWDGRVEFFRNTGTEAMYDFELEPGILGLTDVGNNATPALADIDSDGDLDLFVGNFDGTIHFYRNEGSSENPLFILATANYADIDVFRLSRPAFADINGDDDLDLFVGNAISQISIFRNIGNRFSADFVLDTVMVSQRHALFAPVLSDLDGDGDEDLLSGTFSGGLLYFENAGFDDQSPLGLEPRSLDFGKVLLGATDTADVVIHNNSEVVIAIHSATIYPRDGRFMVSSQTAGIDIGGTVRIGISFNPLIAGAAAAELELNTSLDTLVVPLSGAGESLSSSLAMLAPRPNPFRNRITIPFEVELDIDNGDRTVTIRIYDILGRRINQWERDYSEPNIRESIVWDGRSSAGEVVGSGVYICRISKSDGEAVSKKIILIK